jgi:serine/threonine-protein kinase
MLMQRPGQPDLVKILDFGLAKVPVELQMPASASTALAAAAPQQLTKMGALYGTPGYMSPEQALSEAIDCRADMYSLGSILYEMLTGRTPFDGNSVLELIDEHLRTPLPPMHKRAPAVQVPPPVEALVRTLMAKRAQDRYKDPAELLAAIDPLLAQLNGAAATPPPPAPPAAATTQTPAATPAAIAPRPQAPVRPGTVVALELDRGSLWSRLGRLQRRLPSPLSKVPLPLLVSAVVAVMLFLALMPWLLKPAAAS